GRWLFSNGCRNPETARPTPSRQLSAQNPEGMARSLSRDDWYVLRYDVRFPVRAPAPDSTGVPTHQPPIDFPDPSRRTVFAHAVRHNAQLPSHVGALQGLHLVCGLFLRWPKQPPPWLRVARHGVSPSPLRRRPSFLRMRCTAVLHYP